MHSLNRKELSFVFLFLAFISLTLFGIIFRKYIFYWFFTGTSPGKIIAFFLFAAFVYFLTYKKRKFMNLLPKRNQSLKIFSLSIILLFIIGFVGLLFLYQANVYPLGLENPNSETLFVCALDKPEKIAFFSFLHNHYLKPSLSFILFPITSIIGGDSATALLSFTNPIILAIAFVILLISFVYFLSFMSNFKGTGLSFFFWVLCGYGLLMSVLDGGMFSMAGQVNICLFAVVLADYFIPKNKLKFLAASVLSTVAIIGIVSFAYQFFSGFFPFFWNFILFAPLTSALVLALQKKSFFAQEFIFFLFAVFMVLFSVLVLSFFVPSALPYDPLINQNSFDQAIVILNTAENNIDLTLANEKLSYNTYLFSFGEKVSLNTFCTMYGDSELMVILNEG